MQDWNLTDKVAEGGFAGLENDRLEIGGLGFCGLVGLFGGLENDGLEFGRLEYDRLQLVNLHMELDCNK